MQLSLSHWEVILQLEHLKIAASQDNPYMTISLVTSMPHISMTGL